MGARGRDLETLHEVNPCGFDRTGATCNISTIETLVAAGEAGAAQRTRPGGNNRRESGGGRAGGVPCWSSKMGHEAPCLMPQNVKKSECGAFT
jgi:hypothetical protein